MGGVEGFHNFLGAVSEIAVAEKKTEPAEHEILLMSFDDAVGDECGTGAVVAALPTAATHNRAKLRGAIHFRVFKRFVAAIAPAETGKYADLRSDFLFEVQAKAVTVAPFAASSDDIRKRRLAILKLANRLFVVAHGGLI